MIILATTIIISLSSNGIIDKASEAVDKANEKQVEELVNLAWANAYAENIGKPGTELQVKLQEAVEKALEDNNINKEDYGMEVTTTGVTIVKGWLQKSDRTVVKGSGEPIKIGTYVNYVSGVETYKDEEGNEKGWQVLGAENGELLIMSSTDVANKYFNEEKTLEGGKAAYENGISELNEICAPYGKGVYATGARSITVEDIDRVTGYDKTTYEWTYNDYKIKYGESITYSWDSTKEKYPYYKTSRTEGNLTSSCSSFTYHNGKEWKTSTMTTGDKETDIICTLTQTYYFYDVNVATDIQKVASDAYNMLFGENDGNYYWLGSSSVFVGSIYAHFGLRFVKNGCVNGYAFVYSPGDYSNIEVGVRAVVELSSDTTLTGSSEAGWNIV